MNNTPGASKVLDLLEGLKQAVQDCSARSEKLVADFNVRRGAERQRCDRGVEEQEQQLAAALAEADARLAAVTGAADARYRRRKDRIAAACQSSREKGLEKVEQRIGGLKYELQKEMIEAERARDAGLAGAAEELDEFRKELVAEQEALAHLERSAQRACAGYRAFSRLFFEAYEKGGAEAHQDHEGLLNRLRDVVNASSSEVGRFRSDFLLRLFRYWLVWLILAAAVVPVNFLLRQSGLQSLPPGGAWIAALGVAAIAMVIRSVLVQRARPAAAHISESLARARRLHDACAQASERFFHDETGRVSQEFQQATVAIDHELKKSLAEAAQARITCRMKADERTVRANTANERQHQALLAKVAGEHQAARQRIEGAAQAGKESLRKTCDQNLEKAGKEFKAGRTRLEADWKSRTGDIWRQLQEAGTRASELFPPWSDVMQRPWAAPKAFPGAAKFAEIEVDLEALCGVSLAKLGLPLPGPARFGAPLCLACPEEGSVLFEAGSSGREEAIAALNATVLRLLAVAPPGRVNFTVIDPVGLGQNFAGIMHLADYEEQLITNRIWTQSAQVEQRLADLNEHVEKVIQMYLRNEYQTIAEYNEQAGVIAEKYHFLVVADFPAGFSDVAAKRLLSLAASGPRCGVYTLIHWDPRQPVPQDFIPDGLRKNSACLASKGAEFVFPDRVLPGTKVVLELPPEPEQATDLIHQIGRQSRDSSRVEVPFEQVIPENDEIWSEDTTGELRVPIGRTGATKLQYLAIGKGTCQHGLVAGKTGSGKSTLFHVLITNLALWCSPEQVEFYLVDFKKGVEFKCYAARQLPHARVVAIESDREFGLSVLQRVDEELKERGDKFRRLGVQDIAGYKRAGGKDPIPRVLLLVDEFQEFFVEDDRISQTASLLLDRIVRQGRAFGIHVLLGSQTLGGAYTVARTTLGQMVIRIALQCNEADAYLIMDENNPAPRLLSRPGEGIYNDMAGALEGNSPFQVVWLPDGVRDSYLARIRARADQAEGKWPGPIVFEGNAPADVRENAGLKKLLANPGRPADGARIWLGAPNSIKGPTEVVFRRQSGNNLLMVGQRDESALAMLGVGLICLSAQHAPGKARFVLCDVTPHGTPQREFIERVVRAAPHRVEMPRQNDLPRLMKELGGEMSRRAEDPEADSAPPVFLFIHALQKFTKLRHEEDFGYSASDPEAPVNPAAVLNSMICEGARLGFHVVATCDTWNNVSRFLSRKALSEFEMRVLFQMSANDSASLIDNPKASTLGLHRALLFNAQEGYLETFRPYALPAGDWVQEAGASLARAKAWSVERRAGDAPGSLP